MRRPAVAKEPTLHVTALDGTEVGPPPLRRAAVGLLLGLVTGAVASMLLPRERRRPAPLPPDLPREDPGDR